MKKRVSLYVVIILIIAAILAVPALADTSSIPSLSSNKYIKTYALNPSGRAYAYKNYDLRESKGSNYWIDREEDECYIVEVRGNAVKVSYPIGGGKRSVQWFQRSEFTGADLTQEFSLKKATSKITSYRRCDGWDTYGYVGKGDVIYLLGYNGNYSQVIYPLSDNNWKMAWISNYDAEHYLTDAPKDNSISSVLYGGEGNPYILCDFNEVYNNGKGRHEGIDFCGKERCGGYGMDVYSLTEGTILRVKTGKRGRGTNSNSYISMVCVYNKSANVTIIYMHLTPNDKLEVGQTVKVGDFLGTECDRGAVSIHTHVEIRDGKKTSAAYSFEDKTLDNTNTTSNWEKLGYSMS